MRKLSAFLFALLFHSYSAQADFNRCSTYKPTCKPPKGDYKLDSSKCAVTEIDGNLLYYCSYFQCDSKDNILMNNPNDRIYNPQGMVGNFANWGVFSGYASDGPYTCYANCCYGSKGQYLGQINHIRVCQNLCCPTLEGYLAGNCSAGKKPPVNPVRTPPAIPTPTPLTTMVPTARPEPTFPDLIPENEIPDEEIHFGNAF